MKSYLKNRFLAGLIDFTLIALYIVILFGIALAFYNFALHEIPVFTFFEAHSIGFVTLVLPVILYSTFFEFSHYQGSVGKQIRGLKIVSDNYKFLTLQQVILRNIIKFAQWEYAHILIYIIYFVPNAMNSQWSLFGLVIANIVPVCYLGFIVFGKDNKAPYDLLSRTRVVEKHLN